MNVTCCDDEGCTCGRNLQIGVGVCKWNFNDRCTNMRSVEKYILDGPSGGRGTAWASSTAQSGALAAAAAGDCLRRQICDYHTDVPHVTMSVKVISTGKGGERFSVKLVRANVHPCSRPLAGGTVIVKVRQWTAMVPTPAATPRYECVAHAGVRPTAVAFIFMNGLGASRLPDCH